MFIKYNLDALVLTAKASVDKRLLARQMDHDNTVHVSSHLIQLGRKDVQYTIHRKINA